MLVSGHRIDTYLRSKEISLKTPKRTSHGKQGHNHFSDMDDQQLTINFHQQLTINFHKQENVIALKDASFAWDDSNIGNS